MFSLEFDLHQIPNIVNPPQAVQPSPQKLKGPKPHP